MNLRRYLAEWIGTLLLVSSYGLALSYADKFVGLASAAALIGLLYLFWPVSGAHFNPAVSLAMLIRRELSAKDFGLYLLMQLLGAAAGAGLVMLVVLDDTFRFFLEPGRGDFPLEALLVEMIFTFWLVLTYLALRLQPRFRGSEFYGLAIGMVWLALLYLARPISGGAFNPAIGAVPNLFEMAFADIWIFTVGPFVGAALAAVAYPLLFEPRVVAATAEATADDLAAAPTPAEGEQEGQQPSSEAQK